ncbi:MAG: Lrp/AsnC family transcriptional regulator [Kordiimonadaceae bacterium]|nr:Lrp/AsnC family transcriptional regulator [Kordiimonadaceae bacterium]
MNLSKTDLRILKNLQDKPSLSQSEQADDVGMSRSSYWRHIRDMEDAGVILGKVPVLNARKIGLKIRANCVISLNNHSSETRKKFEKHIQEMPNVLECFATSGGKDYMLTVVARDIDNYYELMSSSILDNPTIESAHTSFVMKNIKSTMRLPL